MFLKFVPKGSTVIGLDDGLRLNKCQAIICASDGLMYMDVCMHNPALLSSHGPISYTVHHFMQYKNPSID